MKSKRVQEAIEASEPAKGEDSLAASSAKKRKRDVDGQATGAATNDEVKTKKVKKDKKDKDKSEKDKTKKKKKHEKESRKEKKDKRKDISDLPEQDDGEDEEMGNGINGEEEKVVKDKKDKKKDKKEKKKTAASSKQAEEVSAEDPIDLPSSPDGELNAQQSSKPDTTSSGSTNPKASAANDQGQQQQGKEKQDRHIVFVGNLPFTATAASISKHFASLSPIAVRCLRNKGDPNAPPCRGIAFVEFGKVWHMRTCLDKFHHSWFEDGVSEGRKINVELTAGGGGKTKQRQQKIKEKNRKLDENRVKRIEKEKAAKTENAGPANPNGAAAGMEDAVHPSRRGRMGMQYQ